MHTSPHLHSELSGVAAVLLEISTSVVNLWGALDPRFRFHVTSLSIFPLAQGVTIYSVCKGGEQYMTGSKRVSFGT